MILLQGFMQKRKRQRDREGERERERGRDRVKGSITVAKRVEVEHLQARSAAQEASALNVAVVVLVVVLVAVVAAATTHYDFRAELVIAVKARESYPGLVETRVATLKHQGSLTFGRNRKVIHRMLTDNLHKHMCMCMLVCICMNISIYVDICMRPKQRHKGLESTHTSYIMSSLTVCIQGPRAARASQLAA